MTVFPAATVVLLFWIVVSFRDPDRGVSVVLAALPLGTFAALEANGLSILVAHLLAVLTLVLVGARRLAGHIPFRMSPAGIFLSVFALYSLFSATVLVRLFEGDFLVFPMSFDQSGLKVSNFFPSTMKPLAPSNSNIAQAGYIALSTLFFLLLTDVVNRRGAKFVETGLVWAAGLNIVLGLLDMMALDDLLAVIRTADYTLNNEHEFMGLPRIIGGFAEASEFGPVSGALFGFFAVSYLLGRSTRDAVLAIGNLAFTVLSFSTTAFAALFVALVLIGLQFRKLLGAGVSRGFGHMLIIMLGCIGLALGAALIMTPLIDMTGSVLTDLFVEKSASSSGLERGAWARSAFDAFVHTFGLGAGAGSLRGNGLASVLAGSVGLPGSLAFVTFLWVCFKPTAQFADPDAQRLFYAARITALTYLSAKLVSGTTPDPTLLLVSVAALAATLRYSPRPNRPAINIQPVGNGA